MFPTGILRDLVSGCFKCFKGTGLKQTCFKGTEKGLLVDPFLAPPKKGIYPKSCGRDLKYYSQGLESLFQDLLPQWFDFSDFLLVGFPTKKDEEIRKILGKLTK